MVTRDPAPHAGRARCGSRGRTAGSTCGAGWTRTSARRALLDRALAAGVTFVAGPAFYPDPAGESELRLCFTSVLPATIDEAVRRLAASLLQTTSAAASERLRAAAHRVKERTEGTESTKSTP